MGATVLVVDDDKGVVKTLRTLLQQTGYDVVGLTETEGVMAQIEQVDLAVLDINMPNKTGIELTREIKERFGPDEFFPVVIITGKDDEDSRRQAFDAGCDDFLTKPVNGFELDMRVRSLLARRAQHVELREANRRLLEAQRKKQDLAALVVHDLRNPISAIRGNLELLIEELHDSSEFVREALGDCHKLTGRALFLVAGLLDVEELSEGLLVADVQEADLESVLQAAEPHHEATIRMRNLTLDVEVPRGTTVRLDADLTSRLVENLLDNAVRYAPRNGRVVVRARLDDRDGALLVVVGNDGPPVPESERSKIFGRYYRLEARRAGARANRGLGLYFCKLAAEAHGGSIELAETDELPAAFRVRIPQ